MAVSNGQILRVAVRYVVSGQDDQVNVFHMRMDTGGPQEVSAVLDDLTDFCQTLYGFITAHIATPVEHANISVFNVTGGGPVGDSGPQASMDGTAGADLLPPQVTALLVLPSPVSRVQGRFYLPSTVEGDNEQGALSAAYRGVIEDFGDMLLNSYEGASSATYSYVIHGESGTNLAILRKVMPYFRIQRRRQFGRGA